MARPVENTGDDIVDALAFDFRDRGKVLAGRVVQVHHAFWPAAHAAPGDGTHLAAALDLADRMLELFESDGGGFFTTVAGRDPLLPGRFREIHDGAMPAGISVALEVLLRLAEEVTFLNRGAILHELNEIPDGSTVVIDTSATVHIDHDVLEIIQDFEVNAQDRDILVQRIEPATAPAAVAS